MEARASYEQFFNQSTAAPKYLQTDNWSPLKTEGDILLDYTPIIDLKGGGAFGLRSDGYQMYRLNASSDIELGGFRLTPGASTGSIMPTPQQFCWQSAEIEGNPDLQNEKIQEVRAELSYRFTPDTRVGLRAQHKDITDGIMMADSAFTNVEDLRRFPIGDGLF
ncbi:MAG: hypothetical protein U5J63_02170 [Fodinibius sp.]|nr:hypothetical protein [Fodinibius sp.]